MIVSRMTMEFPNAPWAGTGGTVERAQKVFKRIVRKDDTVPSAGSDIDRMSLGELLYFALIEQGTMA